MYMPLVSAGREFVGLQDSGASLSVVFRFYPNIFGAGGPEPRYAAYRYFVGQKQTHLPSIPPALCFKEMDDGMVECYPCPTSGTFGFYAALDGSRVVDSASKEMKGEAAWLSSGF